MGVFEVSRQAQRRLALAGELPSERPDILDEITGLLAQFPDPEVLHAESRAGSLTALARLRNQIDALLHRVAGVADAAGDSTVLGAGSTGMLVAVATGSNPAAGSAMVNRAKALRDMPATEAAFEAGDINAVAVMTLCNNRDRIDDFAGMESALVGVASAVEPAELSRLVQLLVEQSRPEELEQDRQDCREKRSVSLSRLSNGLWRLDGHLDEAAGRTLAEALEVFTDEPSPDDPRSKVQRRADGLADIAAAAMARSGGRPSAGHTSVLVDLEQIEGGGVFLDGVATGQVGFDLISCATTLSVIFGVHHGGAFVPLALGRSARRASAAQWAALAARDRGCIRCGRVPRFCQAHHVVHWARGGLTDLSNMVLMCSRCHHDLHAGVYTVTMTDGVPEIRHNKAPPLASAG